MKNLVLVTLFIASAIGAPGRTGSARLPAGLQVNENALNSDSKIIGGAIVEPNKYPFVASFQRRALAGFSHSCGAIIYKPKWVITAAQCIDSIVDVSLLRVVGGEFSFEDSTGYEQVRGVNRIIPYSRYNYETLEGDLALLELNVPFDYLYPYNGTIGPAKLPTRLGEEYRSGLNVTVTGWGAIVSGGVVVDKQRDAVLKTYSDFDCQVTYGSDVFLPAMMCAGLDQGGAGPCNGDVGGPLIADDGTVVGVTSWIYNCGSRGSPSVYTQLSYYIDWIDAITSTSS